MKQLPKNYQELTNPEENNVLLCKNHHWFFDHKLLTDDELEKVYQEKKEFINKKLKIFINTKFETNPKHPRITSRDKRLIKNFEEWLLWLARVFFIKN